jgi:signal transduction histidine kinase
LIHQIKALGIPNTEFTQIRYQQMLRQLESNCSSITDLFEQQWQLQIVKEKTPIASLLKRSLERVDKLLQQKKLWVGVHGLGLNTADDTIQKTNVNLSHYSLIVVGDVVKIELVINEVLLSAVERSLPGGRIDFWCRRLESGLLELSITDNGTINAQLLAELYQNTPKDLLVPSYLDQPPGLHLLICQNLMQQMQTELHFYSTT